MSAKIDLVPMSSIDSWLAHGDKPDKHNRLYWGTPDSIGEQPIVYHCMIPMKRVASMSLTVLRVRDEDGHVVRFDFTEVWAIRHGEKWAIHAAEEVAAQNPSLEWQ